MSVPFLKIAGSSLLWNVWTCLWNVYLTKKQNDDRIKKKTVPHSGNFLSLWGQLMLRLYLFFFLVRKAHRHGTKYPWIVLSLVWGQLILSQWLFTVVRKTHKCLVFVPAALHLLLLYIIYGSGNKEAGHGAYLCIEPLVPVSIISFCPKQVRMSGSCNGVS